ncbi:MAG: hypothetical protein AAF768_03115 [Pseudomonadota bacterium]
MIFEIAGWISFGVYLWAHALVSIFRSDNRPFYYLLNIIAAVLLMVSSFAIASWQSVLINLFWGVVSYAGYSQSSTFKSYSPRPRLTIAPGVVLLLVGVVWSFISFEATLTILGWAGVWLFCGAYLLFASERITRRGYLWFSIISYALLLPIYYVQANWPSFTLGVFWTLITVFGLIELRLQRRSSGERSGEDAKSEG